MVQKIGSLILCAAALAAGSLYAQNPGLPFLNESIGARARSLGGASLAEARDASAVVSNPSALARLRSQEIFLSYGRSYSDYQNNFLAYARPFPGGNSAFGAAWMHLSKGNFDGRDDQGRPTGDFTASDTLASLAYSRNLGRNGSLGVSAKWIQSKVESFSADGWAMDFSGSYQAFPKTRVAGGIYHLGPKMRMADEAFPLPAQLAFGISREWASLLTLTSEARYGLEDRMLRVALGGELHFSGIASFRAGYFSNSGTSPFRSGQNSGIDSFSGLGMGVGLNVFSRMGLDYAFVPMGELGGTHHVDLTWRFK